MSPASTSGRKTSGNTSSHRGGVEHERLDVVRHDMVATVERMDLGEVLFAFNVQD